MSIRILVVDDHQIMCQGLRSILERETDLEIVGEASNGRQAIALVQRLVPNLVLMDVGMPDMNGIEATRRIKAEDRRIKVIALSCYADKRYVQHMLDAGASGYLLKMADQADLLRAVRAVSAGKTYLSPEISGFVIERSLNPAPAIEESVYSVLGAREREVLQLVAEGKTTAEVARLMHISTKTAETHRRNIVHKLDLHGTAVLTKYAIREGLTSVDG